MDHKGIYSFICQTTASRHGQDSIVSVSDAINLVNGPIVGIAREDVAVHLSKWTFWGCFGNGKRTLKDDFGGGGNEKIVGLAFDDRNGLSNEGANISGLGYPVS